MRVKQAGRGRPKINARQKRYIQLPEEWADKYIELLRGQGIALSARVAVLAREDYAHFLSNGAVRTIESN